MNINSLNSGRDFDTPSGYRIAEQIFGSGFQTRPLEADNYSVIATRSPAWKAQLESILRRAEILCLTTGLSFEISENLDQPFFIVGTDHIAVSHETLINPSFGAICIRHAIELNIWTKLVNQSHSRLPVLIPDIAAARCAARYAYGLPQRKDDDWRQACPPYIQTIYQKLVRLESSAALSRSEDFSDIIIALSKFRLFKNPFSKEIFSIPDWVFKVAAPIEYLLSMGGDSRLETSSSSGQNKHGCTLFPSKYLLSFSSSTASTITSSSFRACEELRRKIICESFERDFNTTLNLEFDGIRSSIIDSFQLDKNTSVIFTPSGTDGEIIATYLSTLIFGSPKLQNVLVAPSETGGGVKNAAVGKHYSNHSPDNSEQSVNSSIDGFENFQISSAAVPLRNKEGDLLTDEIVGESIDAIVAKSINDGIPVLLHILDSSKTGVGGPTLQFVNGLVENYGNRLLCVVDACQARCTEKSIQKYLADGHLVMITGSKFFSGPMFSGAVLVPGKYLNPIMESVSDLPTGLSNYSSQSDWPGNYLSIKTNLTRDHNIGLLFRWAAGLRQIEEFYSVANNDLNEIIRDLSRSFETTFRKFSQFDLIEAPILDRPYTDKCWDTIRTIFSFKCRDRTHPRYLSEQECKKIYLTLFEDMSGRLPKHCSRYERDICRNIYHIGQPVNISSGISSGVCILRVAISSTMVVNIFKLSDQTDKVELIRECTKTLENMLRKIEVLINHRSHINRSKIEEL